MIKHRPDGVLTGARILEALRLLMTTYPEGVPLKAVARAVNMAKPGVVYHLESLQDRGAVRVAKIGQGGAFLYAPVAEPVAPGQV